MDRLTTYFIDEFIPIGACTEEEDGRRKIEGCIEVCSQCGGDCEKCSIQECFNKLGEYEDREEQGKLLNPPVALRQTVYRINRGAKEPIIPIVVSHIQYRLSYSGKDIIFSFKGRSKGGSENVYFEYEIGKTVHLSYEDAAEALKGEQ